MNAAWPEQIILCSTSSSIIKFRFLLYFSNADADADANADAGGSTIAPHGLRPGELKIKN